MVAGGGTLLAVKETREFIQRSTLPSWSSWAIVVLMLVASTLNTAVRRIQSERRVRADGSFGPPRD